MPSATDYAYFAGLIDGEGHVQIRPRGGCGLVLCMADLPILEWCHQTIGGTLSNAWKAERGNSRPRKMWFLNHVDERLAVLPRMIPFTVLKRRECELLLEMTRHQNVAHTLKCTEAWRTTRNELCVAAREAMRARK